MAGEPVRCTFLLLPLLAGLTLAGTETPPAPAIELVPEDGYVTVKVSSTVIPVYAQHVLFLQNMNNSEETRLERGLHSTYYIRLNELQRDAVYCVRAQVSDSRHEGSSPLSEPKCFNTSSKELPQHLKVEGIDASFLLKWDWDFHQNPNVTFSVDHCFPSSKKWKKMEGCENITTMECDVSGIDKDVTTEFRVSVYNSQTGERSFNFVEFYPRKQTVIGPPTSINMTIYHNVLYILVDEPEGLKLDFLRGHTWKYELEIWKDSKPAEVITKDEDGPHFRIENLETSTNYCARARVKRTDPHRIGLYSKPFCITTAPASYATQLAIGLVFAGIIVMSGIVYVCLCPLKRYMKHVFFPKTKLPASIEQCLQDSPRHCVKNPFLFHEEERTDKCYIIEGSPAGNATDAAEAEGRDSGNYSNEEETGAAKA